MKEREWENKQVMEGWRDEKLKAEEHGLKRF